MDNIKAQIIKHYQRISDREASVTAEMVHNAYLGIGSEYETRIKAFDKDCANFLKRKDCRIGTYKAMVRARNYVTAFIKSFYKRNDMSMLELTPDFIKEFAAYLTVKRGLKKCHHLAELHVAERGYGKQFRFQDRRSFTYKLVQI